MVSSKRLFREESHQTGLCTMCGSAKGMMVAVDEVRREEQLEVLEEWRSHEGLLARSSAYLKAH